MQATVLQAGSYNVRGTRMLALVAGVFSGAAGLLVFLIYHHIRITPIWFILPLGLVIAALGGLAVGWSYAEIKPRLPCRPWTWFAVMLVVGATLTPAILLAQLRPSLIDVNTGTLIQGATITDAIVRFVVDLLLTATIVGGLAGWWLGRTATAALATAVAGFVFALGPGHNIPFLGNTPGVGNGIILLLCIISVSAIALVESEARLARRLVRARAE